MATDAKHSQTDRRCSGTSRRPTCGVGSGEAAGVEYPAWGMIIIQAANFHRTVFMCRRRLRLAYRLSYHVYQHAFVPGLVCVNFRCGRARQ